MRFAAAVALTAAALGVSVALRGLIQPTLFIFFIFAVVLSAWYGGRGPALAAAALAIPLIDAFLIPPYGTWTLTSPDLIRFALFAVLAWLVGSMRQSLDTARRAAEQSALVAQDQAVELEMQAEEMQAQAAELEAQTEEARSLAVELEEAGARLRASMEGQLAEAQALAHVGSWEWTVGEAGVRWSDEMFRVYGYRPGEVEVTFDTFVERVHPDDRERVVRAVDRAMETGEDFEFDHRIVRPDGAVRALHARGRVEAGPDGRPARMYGSGQDVTDRRAAEDAALRLATERAALAEAEAGRRRLEAILESLGDAFVSFDRGWRYRYLNRRAEETLGVRREDALGRTLMEVFPGVEDGAGWTMLKRVMDERRPAELEYASDVLGRRIVARAFPSDEGISVFYQDVTEQRRAARQAARLAAIVESTSDAVFSKSLDGIVESWNAGAERLYGYPADEMVGRPVSVLAPEDRADEIPAILRRLAAGERIESFETVRKRKDGALVDVLLTLSPILDGEGRVVSASTIARDITGRKRTEAALRESEARYRRLIDTAHEGIWLLDPEGRTTYVNERMAAMLGYAPAEMAGAPLAGFLHPDERRVLTDTPAPGPDGAPERRDVRFRRSDGADLWGLASLSAVHGEDGARAGTLAMVTDVTERRRAEEAVAFLAEASRVLASSLDYQATLASVARLAVPRLADYCAVHLVDASGEPRTVEAAHADPDKLPLLWEMLRRYPPRRGSGTPASTALATGEPVLAPEVDPSAVPGVRDAGQRRITEGLGPRSYMAVPLRAEDRVLGVMTFVASESGRRYGAADLALAEELARRAATAVENARLHEAEQAARRQAERAAARIARLQAVTAALSEARTPAQVAEVVVTEGLASTGAVAGWLMQVAPEGGALELLRAHGYGAEVVERYRRLPLDAPVLLADAVRTGEPVFLQSPDERSVRYPLLAREYGPLGNGAWAAVPMQVEGRAVGGIGLTFPAPRAFDADEREYVLALARQSALALERARLYEAEARARAEAEAANRAKFEFLTTMSHELRTPLNAIAGYVELLELGIRGPVTEAQRQDLERIRRSQKHLLGLINDVLNFARIETGHVHFAFADVELGEALAEAEALISPQLAARGLSYEYRRNGAPVVARADPEKLRQIVLNLLSNAVKFTAAGGRVTLECEALDERTVAVRVHDTGMGIPADKLSTIFEPFVQVNAGYTRTSEGTGLGLSISRDLARAMGGELTAESDEGRGSVFTLTLPRAGVSASGDASSGDASAGDTEPPAPSDSPQGEAGSTA